MHPAYFKTVSKGGESTKPKSSNVKGKKGGNGGGGPTVTAGIWWSRTSHQYKDGKSETWKKAWTEMGLNNLQIV